MATFGCLLSVLGLLAFPVIVAWEVLADMFGLAGWGKTTEEGEQLRMRALLVAGGVVLAGVLVFMFGD